VADLPIVRSGATLAAMAAVCTALVALTYLATADRIAANEQAYLEQSLQPALSGVAFDGGLTDSRVTIPAPHDLPGSEDAVVYRVYAAGEPVAALFAVSARDGYAGAIRLLVGIDIDGVVTGVQVLEHRETPGIGDGIERSRSDWLDRFAGRSIVAPRAQGWKIRRDGGRFDQLTGASVTSRAVVKAIYETLKYYEANSGMIFSAPADTVEDAAP
jgi:electron transport complex protein RnfG